MHKNPKEYFMYKFEEDIREVEKQLNKQETKLEYAGWEPGIDLKKQIDKIRLRLDEVRKEADRFEEINGYPWSVFRRNHENTFSEISRDVQNVTARIDKILLE